MDQIRKELNLTEGDSVLINGLEVNLLTGLYLSHTFYKKSEEFLQSVDADTYCMLAVDLEHFRLFNKIYSREQGDCLLKKVAELLKEYRLKYGGVIGYFGGDNFAVLTYYDLERFKQLHRDIAMEISSWSNTVGFLPAFGVYPITDSKIDIATMYDRATMALKQVVGNYSKRHCVYSSDIETKEEEELLLLSEIQVALKNEEFTFYVQPQCDISTGKIVGGECLVRWIHPTKGLISPGIFVPVLEKNGFIASLDRYVWKRVCKWLRDLIDRGYQPVPVSINVSRIDIYSMDVPEFLLNLLKEYELPSKLLQVEITESAYAENNDKIIRTVKQLRDADLWVMMDDFGSGYSSLNMLKSIAVDVLKLDMRFLDINGQEEKKGIGIIESVVNMARQLQVPIIVEGVETQKQEKFLLKMGCRYSQGFYYYRPMPIVDFEKLISDEHNLDKEGIWCKRVEGLHVNEFLDKNIFSDTLLNNILGPAAFYDMYENNIEITRVNNQYYELAGISARDASEHKNNFWLQVSDEDKTRLFSIFERAEENQSGGATGYINFARADGTILWVRISIFFLRERDGHRMFYGSLTDVSDMRKAKQVTESIDYEVEELTEKQLKRMEKYYGKIPIGLAIAKIIPDGSEGARDYEIVYANHEISRISGGNLDRVRFVANKALSHRKDELMKRAYRAAYLGEREEFRIYSTMSFRYLAIAFVPFQQGYLCCMVKDVTKEHVYKSMTDNILKQYREVYYVHLQENFGRMIYPDSNHLLERGNYEEAVEMHISTGRVLEEDASKVREFFAIKNMNELLKTQDVAEYRYRRNVNGAVEWCRATMSVCERINGVIRSVILTIERIDEPKKDV